MPSKKRSKKPKRIKVLQLDFQELTVDVDKDNADPDPLGIQVNETFVASAANQCDMRFTDHVIFDDQHFPKNDRHFLRPKPGQTGEAFYYLVPFNSKARKTAIEATHSIKVGS